VADLEDLTGTTLDRADLGDSRFTTVLLNRIRVQNAELTDAVIRGIEIIDTTIDGEVKNLVINGVDVAPLIEAELDRRDPDRPKFRPETADGFREAWEINRRRWEQTVARARAFPADDLHVSVDGEWSFIQTLRHLAFASQSWVGRCVLGIPDPWHPLSLPWDTVAPIEGVPQDREARPSLDEALELRADAMEMVSEVLSSLSDDRLQEETTPAVGPGWPPEGSTFPVRECLLIVLNEEWHHRLFAERDLALLGRERQ
jgi:uncharacterized damage-inducible protein DinB